MSVFTHLHVHTEYSLLDGASRIKNVVAKAAEMGMHSLAITDHGSMYGVIEFYREAQKAGIKPIIGCEVYVASGSRKDKTVHSKEYAHLVLLAKNKAGYRNLMKLVSEGYLTGFYYKPRIDYELLEEYSEGLICLSACLAGDIPQLLLKGDYEGAKKMAAKLQAMFAEDFYLELQDHGIPEQRTINPLLLKLADELNIKAVATNDVHYVEKKDADAQDVMLCIGTATTLDEPGRMEFASDEFYLKSTVEMESLFSYAPELIANTQEVADKCHVDIEFGEYHLPHFEVPQGKTHEGYLQELVYDGLGQRYPAMGQDSSNEDVQAITQRADFELNTISEMGFTDYFLIVWDFVRFAKSQDIIVGPGRGSAAGSIVAYALGITNIDPLRYNLLFERFLNPERISMPDIDIDFCYERRPEVIDYVTDKYGEDKVAQIITFGTMGARLVIRDVARVLDMSVAEADRIAKMVPFELNITIEEALKRNDKLRQEYQQNNQVRQVIDISRQLEGMPRHASTHAAGVVIAREPITEYVPLQKNTNDGSVMTQYPMGELESLGLLKMDFLGLRTLTVIRDAVDMVEQNHGISIDIDAIDIEDQKVYQLIASGETEGMFQLESAGMRRLMQDLQPSNLDEIMVGISLFRPGPMDSIPEYLRCKHNPKQVTYAHPMLEPILKDTHGCMVYQEQIMRIVRDVAGYSLARSDLVRRTMSKKQYDVLEKERHTFIYGEDDGESSVDGAVARGMDEKVASDLFDQMMAFANYAFNKSHACAYAMVAYQTAYLKCYYPVEFMTALLNSFLGNKNKLTEYINYLKRTDIKILPPDINHSQLHFCTEDGAIRFGLSAIAYVGEAIEEVIARRMDGYKDFDDFVHKNADVLNKKRLESLILSGCFDGFGVRRSQLMEVYAERLQEATQFGKRQATGQMSLFDSAEEEFDRLKTDLPDIPEFPAPQLLLFEKETTGLYISGHPLDDIKEVLHAQRYSIADIMQTAEDENSIRQFDGQQMTLLGIVSDLTIRTTRQKKQMANLTLEDLYGQMNVIVFPHVYTEAEHLLRADAIVSITGKVTVTAQNGIEMLAERIEPFAQDEAEYVGKQCYVRVPEQSDLHRLRQITTRHKGGNSLVVSIEDTGKNYRLGGKHSVCYTSIFLDELQDALGKENVVIK